MNTINAKASFAAIVASMATLVTEVLTNNGGPMPVEDLSAKLGTSKDLTSALFDILEKEEDINSDGEIVKKFTRLSGKGGGCALNGMRNWTASEMVQRLQFTDGDFDILDKVLPQVFEKAKSDKDISSEMFLKYLKGIVLLDEDCNFSKSVDLEDNDAVDALLYKYQAARGKLTVTTTLEVSDPAKKGRKSNKRVVTYSWVSLVSASATPIVTEDAPVSSVAVSVAA